MLTPPGAHRNALRAQARTLATIWTVTPAYGAAVRVTSHDVEIVVGGNTFSPMGGADPSTVRRQGQLRDHDREFRGVVTSDRFSDADLAAGRWNGSTIDESVVDWTRPFLGALVSYRYRIAELAFDGQVWRASAVGLVSLLRGARGDAYLRHCRHDWGVVNADGIGCPVSAAAFTTGSTATSFGDGARKLQIRASGISGSLADGYFALGKFSVTSGPAAGQVVDVKKYTQATREIELQYPLPAPMNVGDSFSVTAGCDRRYSTCKDKFSVGNAFGGFALMPGTDFILKIKPAA